jgi:uncharacterized damage-inducible protein DinB
MAKKKPAPADAALRAQLADFLNWRNAHAGFDAAVAGIPPRMRGVVPKGFAHSIWQVVEHLRIAQNDILDFSINSRYREKKWPDDYWPKSASPSSAAWTRSLSKFRSDRRAMQRLAVNPRVDLLAMIPHGHGQTYLREILLVADHNAHHVAQIIDLRRALGIWKPRR